MFALQSVPAREQGPLYACSFSAVDAAEEAHRWAQRAHCVLSSQVVHEGTHTRRRHMLRPSWRAEDACDEGVQQRCFFRRRAVGEEEARVFVRGYEFSFVPCE